MISIVAPAYNEEAVIKDFVEQVVDVTRFFFECGNWELIVVDDGSTDRTKDILYRLKSAYPLSVITHVKNYGMGKALETGFKAAKGNIVVTMNADCSHDPVLIPVLCKEIVSTGCHVAIAPCQVQVAGIPLRKRLEIYNAANKDLISGYRAYRASIIKEFSDLPSGYEAQTAILARLKNSYVKEISYNVYNRIAAY